MIFKSSGPSAREEEEKNPLHSEEVVEEEASYVPTIPKSSKQTHSN